MKKAIWEVTELAMTIKDQPNRKYFLRKKAQGWYGLNLAHCTTLKEAKEIMEKDIEKFTYHNRGSAHCTCSHCRAIHNYLMLNKK